MSGVVSESTFRAESAAELTLPLAFSLHLLLVWRTNAHTGAAVHHKMSYKERDSLRPGVTAGLIPLQSPESYVMFHFVQKVIGNMWSTQTNRGHSLGHWETQMDPY